MKTVTIQITGLTGSGKTTVLRVISWALKKHGFNIEVLDGMYSLPASSITKPAKGDYDDRLVHISTFGS